jgi:hypothetical protein
MHINRIAWKKRTDIARTITRRYPGCKNIVLHTIEVIIKQKMFGWLLSVFRAQAMVMDEQTHSNDRPLFNSGGPPKPPR